MERLDVELKCRSLDRESALSAGTSHFILEGGDGTGYIKGLGLGYQTLSLKAMPEIVGVRLSGSLERIHLLL